MPTSTRYRFENGKTCIDIRVKASRQIFDGRDPAPFRERDLDEDAVEYILAALEEIPAKQDLKIIFWISEETEPRMASADLEESVRTHFTHERTQIVRRIHQHVRRGQMILLIGLGVLATFLSLAEFTSTLLVGTLGQILREGLVITGWVAMWRPIEVLLYDWWPLVEQRRAVLRVLGAEIDVRYGPAVPNP